MTTETATFLLRFLGRWECSHRFLRERLWRCSTPGSLSRLAAPSLFHVSVMTTRGPCYHPLSHERKNFFAACLLRRLCTRIRSRAW